ncbi:YihA family ribosome biogenesis GTP-binding protein [Alginatibacterium sediminis]|uniref:Probable GTP-binding protein EngB n=1 Tax=Alginatibacterium sediminis TaxID=2164068 RepID=A0A420ENB0_9ALTE|nr:ribosome biogenesis GTP-binding protein YihA/YsxC [Alginatibacterium sediminis]RKF22084.1 YihA family ribosome biogenesis GTP-binding protein [Alginatibacterium sediminis]
MPRFNFQNTHFVTSAPNLDAMPEDSGIEIAFAGRSNAGKSSALNTLTRQKSLARTSKTPGRTQLINVFEVEDGYRLIDLPGYGFAKVPEEVKKQWQKSLSHYLQNRESLRGIVILMDIRHPLRDLDLGLIQWAVDSDIAVLALLTKADKLKQGPRKSTLLKCREELLSMGGNIQVETFSSLKRSGLDVVQSVLGGWFEDHQEPESDTESQVD